MKVLFQTPVSSYAKEVGDVIALFFEGADYFVNIENCDPDLIIEHTERTKGSVRECRVTMSGTFQGNNTLHETVQGDALTEKRLHKRQVKRCVYAALKQAAHFTPPWGSLTGVRPTRLLYESMGQGKSLRSAVEHIVTTFDVSAVKAVLLRDIVVVQSALPPPMPRDVDIYIGIPFCTSRCRYCSFLSAEVGDGRMLAPYVQALCGEVAEVLKLIEQKDLSVRAFYMGGGTPTALPYDLLESVLVAAGPLISAAREATVEAGRPDTLDERKLSIILASGASRISINPQTMHNDTLRLIGRGHTRAQTENAYALARQIGFHHINMDLIAGLPGENEAMFSQTLAWERSMQPESLTIHTLSVKRSSLMHLWGDRLPGGEMVSHMVESGRKHAQANGMHPYYLYRQKHQAGNLENVGYALKDHACLYNIDMMEDVCSVLALGAGAISKRVWPGREKIVRSPNVKQVQDYIVRAGEMARRKEALWEI